MLTVESLKKYTSRNQLAADIKKGKISEKELVNAYSRMRKNVMAQIRKIQKSDIPFLDIFIDNTCIYRIRTFVCTSSNKNIII